MPCNFKSGNVAGVGGDDGGAAAAAVASGVCAGVAAPAGSLAGRPGAGAGVSGTLVRVTRVKSTRAPVRSSAVSAVRSTGRTADGETTGAAGSGVTTGAW